jgi:hypothetical protein
MSTIAWTLPAEALWNATEAVKPPPLAAATIAKFATVCPVTQFTLETRGISVRLAGKARRFPADLPPTAVRLKAIARAFSGTSLATPPGRSRQGRNPR